MIAATVCPVDVPNCTGLLDFNLTLVIQVVIFGLTAAILWQLIWRPIVEILEKRDQRLAAGEYAGREAERLYEEGLAEVQTILEQARISARELLAEAYRSAGSAAEKVRAAAVAEARALTEAALTEIRGERDAAVASLRTRAVELAVLAASRLLHSDLDVQRYAPIAAQAVPQ
jgi:F-type H+-transporting ATPase subunit b